MSASEISSSLSSSRSLPDPSANLDGYEWAPGEFEAFCMQHVSDLEKMRNLTQPSVSSIDNNQPNEEQVVKTKGVYASCCLIS